MKQAKNADDFFKRLIRLIASDIESGGEFNACPVAGFSYQIGSTHPMQKQVQEVTKI